MPDAGPLRLTKEGVVLAVHVQPGARREGAGPLHGDRLRVRVNAPPDAGRANARVVEFVTQLFGLKRADVLLMTGATSRKKDLLLCGMPIEDATRRLGSILADVTSA